MDRGPDRPGLLVTVYSDGTAGFEMRYTRGGGRRTFMPLGSYGMDGGAGLSLADACDKHDAMRKLLAKGIDPIEYEEQRQRKEVEGREEREGADTIASLVEQFVHRKLRAERWDAEAGRWARDPKAKTKARKRPEAAASLLGYVETGAAPKARKGSRKPVASFISELGKRKARDVSRRDVVSFLDGIVDRGSPVTANRTHALLVQLFSWAAAKDLIPASPMAGIERPGGEERPRERVLTSDEIKKVWTQIDTADMAAPTGLALKLLLVTGQRRGEITRARWSDIDMDSGAWTIPVELLKTSHSRRLSPTPHIVPLSPLAAEILTKLRALTGTGAWVLPAHASTRHDEPYSDGVLTRAIRQNAKHLGVSHFTPHDLRRTAASWMTRLKVPRLHVEKVLNHSTSDIAEVYDRHDYLSEKRTALETWGEHLSAIVEGRNQKVTPMVRHG